MRYKEFMTEEIKLNNLALAITKHFDAYCKGDIESKQTKKYHLDMANQALTSVRQMIVKYDKSLQDKMVKQLQSTGHNVLAKLLSKTVYPIRYDDLRNGKIYVTGGSVPFLKPSMCPNAVAGDDDIASGNSNVGGSAGDGTGAGTGNGTGAGTGKGTGSVKDGSGIPGYTPPGKGSTTGQGTTDQGNTTGQGTTDQGKTSELAKYAKEGKQFNKLLQDGDYEGALEFLDGNPGFAKVVGSDTRKDLEGQIQAQKDQEQADLEAEKSRIAAEKKAQEEAAAKAEAEKKKREEALQAEAEAREKAEAEARAKAEAKAKADAEAKAKADAEAERLRIEKEQKQKEAEEARIKAERLKKEREEELKRLEKERDEETADNDANGTGTNPEDEDKKDNNVEEFDWEELQ
jgi:hypothetical protein